MNLLFAGGGCILTGKKWSAAEKHFGEKEQDLRSKAMKVEAERNQLKEINKKLLNQVDMQRVEIDRLNEWVDRLLEYSELSREDISKACERDKSIASMGELFELMRGLGGYGY